MCGIHSCFSQLQIAICKRGNLHTPTNQFLGTSHVIARIPRNQFLENKKMINFENNKRKKRKISQQHMPLYSIGTIFFDEIYIHAWIRIRTAYLKPHVYASLHHTTQSLLTIQAYKIYYSFVLTLKSICRSGEAITSPRNSFPEAEMNFYFILKIHWNP